MTHVDCEKRRFKCLIFLLLASFLTPLRSSSQGFCIGNLDCGVDSLLSARKSVDHEAVELFDYLTGFKYFSIDRANEFVSERQTQKKNRIAITLRDSLKIRYKVYSDFSVVSRDPKADAWFHIGKYNFNTETFSMTFGDPYFDYEVVGSRNRKELREEVEKRVRGQSRFTGAYLKLNLDKGQRKPFVVHISPDDAERLIRQLDYETVECEAAVEILQGARTKIVTEKYQSGVFPPLESSYLVIIPYRITAFTFTIRGKGTILQWRAQ